MSDHNVNLAECLKTVSDFGVNHIHNVCSGSITDVPWGSVDWLGFFGIAGFIIAVILMFGAMATMIIRDM